MHSKLLIGAIAFVFIGVLGVAFLQHPSVSYVAPASASTNSPVEPSDAQAPQAASSQPAAAPRTASSASSGSSGTAAPASSGYTMAQVAKHDSASSCWTAIDGKVYDLTNWIDQHPGGQAAILSLCGTDGSAAFNAQHGGQGRPARELAQFLLGPLAR